MQQYFCVCMCGVGGQSLQTPLTFYFQSTESVSSAVCRPSSPKAPPLTKRKRLSSGAAPQVWGWISPATSQPKTRVDAVHSARFQFTAQTTSEKSVFRCSNLPASLLWPLVSSYSDNQPEPGASKSTEDLVSRGISFPWGENIFVLLFFLFLFPMQMSIACSLLSLRPICDLTFWRKKD